MAVDLKTARKQLEQKQQELMDLQKISEQDSKPVELDQQSVGRLSRMDAMQGQAMAQEQQRRRHYDLVRIEAAFRRIENDEYGYCLECGEDIADKRLEIDLMATLCIRCAALNER